MHSANGRSGNAIVTGLFASTLSPFSRNAHAKGLAAVCIIYGIVMGWLLVSSHFIPFVFDNNETFSSIIHAQNMASLPFRLTFGLTNESYGLDPAAHPYVYTHQGNFPRLFSFGLLLLGADTPQAQIVLTTFSVGLASIVMAYLFIARIASPFIALLYCVILLTDYIMSSQWWINTWRVWHFFLFFAFCHLALLIAQSRARAFALVCAGLLSAIAVYTEIAFAAFALAFFTVYVCWLARRSPRVCLAGLSVAILGAVLGATVLLIQIGAYLGWDGLKTDLALTFSARNGAPGDELNAFMSAVWDFMRKHNLVYWDNNILSSTPLRSPWVAVTHYFRYNFLPYSPLVTLLSIAALMAIALAQAPVLLGAFGRAPHWKRFLIQRCLPPEQAVAFVLPAFAFLMAVLLFGTGAFGFHHHQMPIYSEFLVASLAATIVAYFFVTPAASPFTVGWGNDAQIRRLSLCAGGFLVLVTVIHASGWLGPFSYPSAIVRSVCLIALIVVFHALCLRAARPMRLVSVLGCVVFCFVVAGFTRLNPALYDTGFGITGALFHPTWKGLVSRLGGFLVWQLVVCLTMMLGCLSILTRSGSPSAARLCRQFMPLVAVLVTGAIAFVAAYILFPGYVFTAYQNRYCPFTVFINVIPLAALGVFLTAGLMQDVDAFKSTPFAIGSVKTVRRLSAGLAVACIAYWGALQNTYLKAFPANRLSEFFAELQRMKGMSTAVSTYAAPIAALTKSWSYFDPAFFTVSQKFDGQRFVMTHRDERYLWLADRDSNGAYKQPSHFVCWMHSNLHDLVLGATPCGSLPGIKAIRSKFQPYFENVEVARDKVRDLWSIVRLDYEAPGSLRRVYEDLEVRAIVVPDKVSGGWRLKPVFQYFHQDGIPLRGVKYALETITCSYGMARRVKSETLTETDLFLPSSFSGIARLEIDVITGGLKESPWKSAPFVVGLSQEKSEVCFGQSIADGLLTKADLSLYLEIDERGAPDRWMKTPATQLFSPIRAP